MGWEEVLSLENPPLLSEALDEPEPGEESGRGWCEGGEDANEMSVIPA